MAETGGKPSAETSAVLEHLTGSSRGRVNWLSQPALNAVLDQDGVLRLYPAVSTPSAGTAVATLETTDGTVLIAAAKGRTLWIVRCQIIRASGGIWLTEGSGADGFDYAACL